MKVLMFSVRDDEEAAIRAYEAGHAGVEITTRTDELHPDTLDQVAGFDALVIQQRSAVGGDAAFYEKLAANGLKQIATRTAGYDAIEVDLAKNAGLKVTNVPAYSPRSVGEMALMQIFRLLRNTYAFDARVANQDFRWAGLQSREIYSVTVGIIGVGRIGGTLAKLLNALGVKVLGYDVKPNPDLADIVDYTSLEDLLAQADVVSLHVDLNATSENLLSADRLAGVKPGLLLVNASRGPVVDTDALIAALEDGRVAAAALDTVEGEGPIFNNDWSGKDIPDARIAKLLAMPNVILTPHVAFFTNIAVQNMVDISLDDAITIAEGGESAHEI